MPAKKIPFNYIITIHNKESLIRDVLLSVIRVAGINSYIYPVLDGCTDASSLIVDEIIRMHPQLHMIKLRANDVHELKTINTGLRAANQSGEAYNIILQDDVILLDTDMEEHCIQLYSEFDQLGMISFRHGGNISRELIQLPSSLNPLQDYIQSECGHYPDQHPILKIGTFVFRETVIKSPVCIPSKIIRELGIPDESYAPWDDHAYCYKVSEAGYANGVFAINFVSDVSWGTTRNKSQEIEVEAVQRKNLDLFRSHNPVIPPINKEKYNNDTYVIFENYGY